MENVCSTCEDPSKLVDLSVFVVFEDKPANVLLGKKDTESACNEPDGEKLGKKQNGGCSLYR